MLRFFYFLQNESPIFFVTQDLGERGEYENSPSGCDVGRACENVINTRGNMFCRWLSIEVRRCVYFAHKLHFRRHFFCAYEN